MQALSCSITVTVSYIAFLVENGNHVSLDITFKWNSFIVLACQCHRLELKRKVSLLQWLDLRAGKMKRILRSDWLPEQQDVAHVWLFQSREKKFTF